MFRLLMILMVVFSVVVQAADSQVIDAQSCHGRFKVRFDSQKVEFRKAREISAWIPGTVELGREQARCAAKAMLYPLHSNQIQLKGPGHTLQGQLFDDGYQALVTHRHGGYELPLDSSGVTQFWLRLPSAGFAPAGDYSARLRATLLSPHLNASRLVNVTYQSLPVVSMQVLNLSQPWLSKRGNHYRVEMGEMSRGAKRDIDLGLRSNAAVSIEIASEHGALQHQQLAGETIDYQLTLQGHTWNPTLPMQKNLGVLSSNRYTKVPLTVNVAPQPRAYAGRYTDRLTITISAK